MPLYSLLVLISISGPLILSFDTKVNFYRYWRSLFPAAFIIGSLYIAVDIFFVKYGIWGFNPVYHSAHVILGLPIEEWMFFIVIPYACVFIHFVFVSYFPDIKASDSFVRIFSIVFVICLGLIVILNADKAYTVFNFTILIIAILLGLLEGKGLLNRFYITFLIMLVPFFITNSILTGTFIDSEVVWYNNSEILGIRILTFPVEDAGYAFSLGFLILLLINWFELFFQNRKKGKNDEIQL